MKKTKLTLKIGKKTYKATTNSKGVATFKVKLTKKGKYTGTVKFAGNKYFKALSKKVKITVKKQRKAIFSLLFFYFFKDNLFLILTN